MAAAGGNYGLHTAVANEIFGFFMSWERDEDSIMSTREKTAWMRWDYCGAKWDKA